jgi:hypothetical protein
VLVVIVSGGWNVVREVTGKGRYHEYVEVEKQQCQYRLK